MGGGRRGDEVMAASMQISGIVSYMLTQLALLDWIKKLELLLGGKRPDRFPGRRSAQPHQKPRCMFKQ